MESPEIHRIAKTLADRVENGANATQIADAIVSVLHEIEAVLSPIIGQRGVAMLYKRSLYLVGPTHSWLAGVHDGIQVAVDLTELRSVFEQQSSANAAIAGDALLQTFHILLSSLIGPSLTERLLRPVWAPLSSGPPAQDTTS